MYQIPQKTAQPFVTKSSQHECIYCVCAYISVLDSVCVCVWTVCPAPTSPSVPQISVHVCMAQG